MQNLVTSWNRVFFQEWFSKNILSLSNDFRTSNASTVGDLPKLNDNSVQVTTHTILYYLFSSRHFGFYWLSFSSFQIIKMLTKYSFKYLSQTLISLAREFEELADTCLLVLHLEVRVHCFHYLHPIWKGPAGAQFAGGQDSTDPNPEVVKLTKDLIQVHYVS